MQRLREWTIRLRNMRRPQRSDGDLEQELRAHLELAAAEGRVERGVAASMDALRDQRGVRWLDDLIRDVRFGLRMLWRDRAVSLVVIVVLAVGICASTAIYSLVNACLLRQDRPVDDRWVVIRAPDRWKISITPCGPWSLRTGAKTSRKSVGFAAA